MVTCQVQNLKGICFPFTAMLTFITTIKLNQLMDVPLFPTTITNKVYKESAILIATLFGGPLVAGYLMAENFKQLGEPHKVKKTWLWTIVCLIAILIHAFAVPH